MASTVQYHELKNLEELLSCSVIHIDRRIDRRGTQFSGTGFSIGDRLAITCGHLFTGPDSDGQWTDPPPTTTLLWQGMEGQAKVRCLRTKERQDLPDLAFLEDVSLDIPAVMLSNDWDLDNEYYAFGFPKGRFEAGDSLVFKYDGTDSQRTGGMKYKKLHGPFGIPGGFSGSPILNRAKGKVCGLVAMSLRENNTAEGILSVPVSYVINDQPDLIERQRVHHRRTMCWPRLTPSGLLWQDVEKACADLSLRAAETVKGAAKEYYQPREIEKDICDFFETKFVGMFIVGKSGMGKTTLLARLAQQQKQSGNLFAMINSVELTLDLHEFEKDLAFKLGLVDAEKHKHSRTRFWKVLDDEAEWRGQRLIICIDAVNEYNQGKESPRPVMLLDCLDKLAVQLSETTRHIKLLITCRPETWRQALNTLSKRLGNSSIYYQPNAEIAWTLSMFTQDEFAGAYANYSLAGSLKTPYEELSGLAKYHLRDPFLLKLAESAFRNRKVPREFDTGDLFKDYIDGLKKANLLELVEGMVEAMFLDDETMAPIASGEEIKRAAIRWNGALATSRPNLHKELDFGKELLKGFELREKNVIREWTVNDESGEAVTQIRFTYDRFAEHMLSKRLALMIFKREKKGESIATGTQAVIGVNLNASQRMAIVSGAIQRTLIQLKSEKAQYASILRAVASIDARGQWLVISVLARTAKNVDGGIELLTSLLNELGEKDSGSDRQFPVIDAVYRVLRDEDYRLWLDEQASDVKERHLESLHGYFVAGLKSNDQKLFTAAIQYLFFLWKASSVRGFEDGLQITRRLADKVKPLAHMAIKKQSRSMVRGLAAVFLLILPEAIDPRFSKAIDLSSETIRRLKLPSMGEKAAFLLNTVLIDYFLKILDQLPNPIQLSALNHYFKHKHNYLPDAEEVIGLLRVESRPHDLTVDVFKRLTRNDNSFIVQMLTFVLSTRYERSATDAERAEVLETIEQCFFAEPRTEISEYCSSLSIYHINCFGSHATKASMDLMGRMAGEILSKRKGMLTISDKRHNFNIIGTYGRALHQNENIISAHGAMQYALDALRQAKEIEDFDYYLYICENLGLLGVLVEPKYLFEVFAAILKEVRVLPMDASFLDLPFSVREIAAARNTIMQSLANIRVLYREQVDKYLLEVLESPELYAEIANERTPDFKLSFFFSWSFEQLMFRCFVSHYKEMGNKVLDAFLDAVRCDSASNAARVVLAEVFNHVAGLSR